MQCWSRLKVVFAEFFGGFSWIQSVTSSFSKKKMQHGITRKDWISVSEEPLVGMRPVWRPGKGLNWNSINLINQRVLLRPSSNSLEALSKHGKCCSFRSRSGDVIKPNLRKLRSFPLQLNVLVIEFSTIVCQIYN